MIGIGITTKDRHDIAEIAWDNQLKHLPRDYKLVVVDDSSYEPQLYEYVDNMNLVTYRFDNTVGIAKAKNKCLQLLDDCDHIFLFDNDCWPIADDWWVPYIESGENHLMYQFDLPNNKLTELYRDDKIVAYDKTRGAMLYVTRKVLDTVGGMDTRFYNAFDHPDWSWRIYNAGLTTHRAMDVVGSDKLFYCLDQDAKVKTSIKNRKPNSRLYQLSKTSKEFREFRNG